MHRVSLLLLALLLIGCVKPYTWAELENQRIESCEEIENQYWEKRMARESCDDGCDVVASNGEIFGSYARECN